MNNNLIDSLSDSRRALLPAPWTHRLIALALIVAITSSLAYASVRRDIVIVGSSTVYPFSSFVAEYFGLSTRFFAPRVESTGTGGGFKYFCQGVGLRYPDLNNASRAIKKSEIELCRRNGVNNIFEIQIGLDSIVLVAHPQSPLRSLSINEIYLALARWIPDADSGEMIENPYQSYDEINPALANLPIRVLGPPPTSGTRDSFVELVLEKACKRQTAMIELKKQDKSAYKRYCRTVREDGAFVEAGENDNLILRKVSDSQDGTIGITGFNFYIQNRDLVQALRVEGVMASRDSVVEGRYPVSRPLYIYLKGEHIDMIPGLGGFVDVLLSDFIIGANGRLYELGLITPDAESLQLLRSRWAQQKQAIFGIDPVDNAPPSAPAKP